MNLQIYFSKDRDIHFYFQETGKWTHLRIEAVSNISAMNVETPFNWLSPAPTRAKMQSTMDTSADSHGTKHPIWAMRTTTPVWRIYVDLPPMLGPTNMVSTSKIINLFLLLINWTLLLNCTSVTNYLGHVLWHTRSRPRAAQRHEQSSCLILVPETMLFSLQKSLCYALLQEDPWKIYLTYNLTMI